MRIYPNEFTIRAPVVYLLEIYNSGIFRTGRRFQVYDQKFIDLLLLEFVGLDDLEQQKPLDQITNKFLFGKLF
jgi:hypothetical protein